MKTASLGRVVLTTVVGFLALAGCLFSAPDGLVVKTADGRIHGKLINSGKVRAYLGIPYAAPPVGELRWQAPHPLAKWTSELDATRYGRRCAQKHVFDDMIFQDGKASEDFGSEDCLTLNVYVPVTQGNAKLPVMFWIHGGGYLGGASSEPRHNGDFLPLQGIVLVTINYRLGVFGFLSLPDLTVEQGGASGNYGLMDMVAALAWVKKNIAGFGGDADCVTIFGESAGSFAVSALMAAPSARELFHRAIGESGGALHPIDSLNIAGAKHAEWAKKIGAETLAQLRSLSTQQLLEAASNSNGTRFGPIVDGRFISEPVGESYDAGKQAKVPLLAGFNRDEGSFLAIDMTAEKWRALSKQRYAADADKFLRLYPALSDEQATRSAADFGGDQFIAYGTWEWMERDRRTGNKDIYRYKLDLAAPPSQFHPDSAAFHSDDIEYVFGTLDTRPGAVWRAQDYALSAKMMSYWTNFAKNGDPNGLDKAGQRLPDWPKYGDRDPVLHLDDSVTSRPDENRARYEFLRDSAK